MKTVCSPLWLSSRSMRRTSSGFSTSIWWPTEGTALSQANYTFLCSLTVSKVATEFCTQVRILVSKNALVKLLISVVMTGKKKCWINSFNPVKMSVPVTKSIEAISKSVFYVINEKSRRLWQNNLDWNDLGSEVKKGWPGSFWVLQLSVQLFLLFFNCSTSKLKTVIVLTCETLLDIHTFSNDNQ